MRKVKLTVDPGWHGKTACRPEYWADPPKQVMIQQPEGDDVIVYFVKDNEVYAKYKRGVAGFTGEA